MDPALNLLSYIFDQLIEFRSVVLVLSGFCIGCLVCALFMWLFVNPARHRRFEKQSRAVLKGQINEQIAPFLPGFPFNPSDARFIGKPVDMLIFDGISNGELERVVFLEIKSGRHKRLTDNERMIRDAVIEGRVEFEIFEIAD